MDCDKAEQSALPYPAHVIQGVSCVELPRTTQTKLPNETGRVIDKKL